MPGRRPGGPGRMAGWSRSRTARLRWEMAACGSASTHSTPRWSWRRWRASPTRPSAGCAASTAAAGSTSARWSPRAPSSSATPESLRLIRHDADEHARSVQLYGVDPATVGRGRPACCVDEDRADHIDLNFGCPVPEGHPQGRRRGPAVEDASCSARSSSRRCRAAAVRRPADRQDAQGHRRRPPDLPRGRPDRPRSRRRRRRPARPHRGRVLLGHADWSAIARLKEAVTTIPVLGNGDIWSGRRRACAWSRETGCDGVVVGPRLPRAGRGCSATSRPRSPAAPERQRPGLRRGGRRRMRRHAELLVEFFGERGQRGLPRHPQARRLVLQGLRGRPRGSRTRSALVAAWPSSTSCSASWTSTSRTRASRAEGPARTRRHRPSDRRCPTAGSTPASWTTPTRDARCRPSWTSPVAETRTTAARPRPAYDAPATAARRASRSRPRAPAGAATSSATGPASCTPRRCAGSRPRPRWSARRPTTSSATGSPTASRWPRSPATSPGRSAATPTSSRPPAWPTTSATRRSATTASGARRAGRRHRRVRGQRPDAAAADPAGGEDVRRRRPAGSGST